MKLFKTVVELPWKFTTLWAWFRAEQRRRMKLKTTYNIGDKVWVIGNDGSTWKPIIRGAIYDIKVTCTKNSTSTMYFMSDEDDQYQSVEDDIFLTAKEAYAECEQRNHLDSLLPKPPPPEPPQALNPCNEVTLAVNDPQVGQFKVNAVNWEEAFAAIEDAKTKES